MHIFLYTMINDNRNRLYMPTANNLRFTPRQRHNLHQSILHWERLATGRRRFAGDRFEKHTSQYCACCQAYAECVGCPIAKATSMGGCGNTPWYKADASARSHGYESASFKVRAMDMLRFLISLMPKTYSRRKKYWVTSYNG